MCALCAGVTKSYFRDFVCYWVFECPRDIVEFFGRKPWGRKIDLAIFEMYEKVSAQKTSSEQIVWLTVKFIGIIWNSERKAFLEKSKVWRQTAERVSVSSVYSLAGLCSWKSVHEFIEVIVYEIASLTSFRNCRCLRGELEVPALVWELQALVKAHNVLVPSRLDFFLGCSW